MRWATAVGGYVTLVGIKHHFSKITLESFCVSNIPQKEKKTPISNSLFAKRDTPNVRMSQFIVQIISTVTEERSNFFSLFFAAINCLFCMITSKFPNSGVKSQNFQ